MRPYTNRSYQGPGQIVPSPGGTVDGVLRLGSGCSRPARDGSAAWFMDLFHRQGALSGAALASDVAVLPASDSLVRIQGRMLTEDADARIWVKALEVVDAPGPNVCIFDLANPDWVVDASVVDRAVLLWSSLGCDYREFINAVFIRPRILRGFLCAPASVRHHHHYDGGCIEHSVIVAEFADILARQNPNLDRDHLVTTGLIHDCGKAIEYKRARKGRWELARYGQRVGHKIAGVQLATVAMAQCPALSSERKEALLHTLAASYAPSWAGFRPPRTVEAAVLSAIDRASAEAGRGKRTLLPA